MQNNIFLIMSEKKIIPLYLIHHTVIVKNSKRHMHLQYTFKILIAKPSIFGNSFTATSTQV